MRQRFVTNKSALMVESVDTRDLKSLGPKGRAGSTPAWGTFLFKQELPNICKLDVRQFLFFFFCPHFPHISSLGSRPRQKYPILAAKTCSKRGMHHFQLRYDQSWLRLVILQSRHTLSWPRLVMLQSAKALYRPTECFFQPKHTLFRPRLVMPLSTKAL